MCAVIAAGAHRAHAAPDNGCSTDRNDRITAELALCSTHAYNIGFTQNPTNESDRQYMKEVIALKTTVMMQQMYAQYEYLDATIKRLKTQLERSILTTKLQAAGAAPSNDTSSSASTTTNRNIVLSGAYDCIAETSRVAALNCLMRNASLIRSAIASGNYGDAKRQIEKDVFAYETWAAKDIDAVCKSGLSATRNSLENCINHFVPKISIAIENLNNANKNQNQNQGQK